MAKHEYVSNRKKDGKKNVKLVQKTEPKRVVHDDEDYCELFKVQGELLERLNKKINRYGDRISNHEQRIKEIEEFFNVRYLGDDCEEYDEVEVEAAAENEAETEASEPEEVPAEELKCNCRCEGYTGPQRVFFIHGCDGKVDYTKPFYSCLDAKEYDPNYKVVPAYVENGKYVRRLTRDEYAAYEW